MFLIFSQIEEEERTRIEALKHEERRKATEEIEKLKEAQKTNTSGDKPINVGGNLDFK